MPWTVDDVDRFKKGLTDKEKRQWVAIANSALERCLKEGGDQKTCEVSAIKQANGVAGNSASAYNQIRTETPYTITVKKHQGEKHLVVPVVMMVEGVHAGSHGPLYHPAEELGKIPESWNGIPVVVYHPEDERGFYVSANSPELVDERVIGRVYNTRFEDGKLKAEAWINENRAAQVAPEILKLLREGKAVDVSVGVFTDDDMIPGEWKNEKYIGVARNHRPDHLAILPNERGACSLEDGCGLGVNSKSNDTVLIKTLQTNYRDLLYKVEDRLSVMDSDKGYCMLEELYDDHIVYRFVDKSVGETRYYKQDYIINDSGGVEFVNEPVKLEKYVKFIVAQRETNKGGDKSVVNVYKLVYNGTESTAWSGVTLKDFGVDGRWEDLPRDERAKIAAHFLIGDADAETFEDLKFPVVNPRTGKLNERALRAVIGGRGAQVKDVSPEVRKQARKKAYELLNDEFDLELEVPDIENLTTRGGSKMGCPDKVKLLVQSKKFTEEDVEWLKNLEDGQLDKLIELTKEPEKEKVEVNKDKVVEELKEKFKDLNTYLEMAPAEIREQLDFSLKLLGDKKQEYINYIKANAAEGAFTDDELNAMKFCQLEKLVKAIPAKVDYSVKAVQANVAQKSRVRPEMLLPFGVKLNEGGK